MGKNTRRGTLESFLTTHLLSQLVSGLHGDANTQAAQGYSHNHGKPVCSFARFDPFD